MSRLFLAALAVVLPGTAVQADEDRVFDVVVYGGSSGGVTAAVQATRMGKTAIVVNPYTHVGGMTSSGLGRTDWGRREVIGGLGREFYQRVREHYRDQDLWRQERREDYLGTPFLQPDDESQWGFEPHAAEQIFRQWLDEVDVPLVEDRLERGNGAGVQMEDQRIEAIVMESGRAYRGRMFIDATYEGDLLAEAGVSYIVGREGNQAYGETLNGIQTARTHNHVFTVDGLRTPPRPLPEEARVDPYVVAGDPSSGRLAGVNPDAGGQDGDPDDRVQSYCYRMCLTDDPENMVRFEQPEGYDQADYELLFRMFEAGEERIPWLPGRMPNRKTDTNNRWAVSTNLVGGSHEYPEASYERRREIEKEHEHWQRGLMWSLANHPRVPEHVRSEVSRWGYAADEFADNDNWPYMIYIRVARRMVSDYVITEHDCRLERVAEDSVGMGSYTMDSHNVQRYVTEHGYVQNEGNIEVPPAGPYVISYRAIVPARGEAENLLVPWAVSASHIAFGSIRMEPVFMILGQSAATAAAMAIDAGVAVQDIEYAALRRRLLDDGQILAPPMLGVDPDELGDAIVVDDHQATLTGDWSTSTHVRPFVAFGYRHDQNDGKGEKTAEFAARLPEPGRYEVRLAYSAQDNRASNVPVTIYAADDPVDRRVDQQQQPPIGGLWLSLGEHAFQQEARVVISNQDTDGYVIIDAVMFVPRD